MRIGKRSIALSLCMLMALTAVVSGTVAYMTDTASLTNRFTIGKVQITLDEQELDEGGEPLTDENGEPVIDEETGEPPRTEEGNKYHLSPGKEFIKDPTMRVLAGSEPSYVRMRVTITKLADLKAIFEAHGEEFKFAEFVKGWDENVWLYETETEVDDTLVMEFRYHEVVDASESEDNMALEPLFTGFIMPSFFTGDDMALLVDPDDPDNPEKNLQIIVIGEAIQNASFADDDEAWAAFENAVGTTGDDEGSDEPTDDDTTGDESTDDDTNGDESTDDDTTGDESID